uniref:Uncharacterized protein n=1 Tax=Sphaerodactylus townsendi TaxID=933632 RepID=A0ACB8GD79_9SAUR
MQTGGSQATELSRPKEGARKTASSHGDPLRSSPPYSGVPSLGFSVATSQNEETREAPLELQEGDGLVAALQSSGLVSKDGRGQIKETQDRRAEQFCKRIHEAAAMAIRASATASIVSKASIVWARKVLEILPPTETKAIGGVNRMLKAASFAADATLDSVTFSARSMASSVAAVGLLWLRAWQTDWRSKAMVSECAFQGEKLFGEDLKEFLVDPKEKPKHLPKPSRNFDRKPSSNFNFRPQQGANQFKRDNFRRSYRNQGRHQNKKGFPYKKNPASDRYNQDNRQSKA